MSAPRDVYQDRQGRTEPPGRSMGVADGEARYVANVRVGSLVSWGVGRPAKILGHSPGCTRVVRRGFKSKHMEGTTEVTDVVRDHGFNVAPGTIVVRR